MCCETEGGIVELFGEIRVRPNRFEPIALPELRYVIFNDKNDPLGLNYKAACVDFELEVQGKTVDNALGNLKKAIRHYIDLAVEDLGREKAYIALIEEINRSSEGLMAKSYRQAEAHTYIYINKSIDRHIRLLSMPYYKDLLKRLVFAVRFARMYASRVEVL